MGESIRIRRVARGDTAGLHDLSVAVVADGRGVVYSLASAVAEKPRTQAKVDEALDPGTCDDHEIVVAVSGDTIVGMGVVRRLRPDLVRHVGVFSLEVHPDYQRRGMGRALLRACIDWSKSHAIERLELNVRQDNERARALYISEGFVQESVRTRFVRLPDGSYLDDLVYVKFL